ncbi:hypothetical protein Za10_1307 [Zymomonas mobilis subsp. mobilis NCIMB 11163]|nr:hypothetical protein Za10_1307 [Zymomonas mobilis subsp. mobilis NCIMB 11163]
MTATASDSDRSFYSAMARHVTPPHAITRIGTLNAAKCSPANFVANAGHGTNAVSYDLASPTKHSKDDSSRARSAARIFAAGRAGVDVYAVRQSRPSPSASGRHPGKAGGTGMLCRGSEVVQAKEEAHLLMRMGAMF